MNWYPDKFGSLEAYYSRGRTPYLAQYSRQKRGAKGRGIEFLLSFRSWLAIWKKSGHLDDRGTKMDQYVMARHGDVGPYAIGNVKIILSPNNIREAIAGKRQSAEHKEKRRAANLGKKRSAETRAKISLGRYFRYLPEDHPLRNGRR